MCLSDEAVSDEAATSEPAVAAHGIAYLVRVGPTYAFLGLGRLLNDLGFFAVSQGYSPSASKSRLKSTR